jgi:iron complex outermembrane recepter protein
MIFFKIFRFGRVKQLSVFKYSTLFFLTLTVMLNTAAAQDCSLRLSGIVLDEATLKPLPGATILLVEQNRRTTSNKNGFYEFSKLCPGNYKIKITHLGCMPFDADLILNKNLLNQNFELLHKQHELSEVSVSANTATDGFAIKSSLSATDFEKAKGGTLGEMLTQLNGVSVLQTGSTIFKPVIHGLHSQRVLILNNGVRQEGQQWGAEHAPEIDPLIAGKLTVIKGVGALKYGSDAIGGAVLVEPRSLSIDSGFHTEVNSVFFSNNRMGLLNAIVEHGGSDKSPWSWRSHLTYKRGGNARTPEYWLHNTGLKELNYSINVGYKKSKTEAEVFFSAFNTSLGVFWGSHIGNLTDLENSIGSKKPLFNIDEFTYQIGRPRQEVSHYLFKTKIIRELESGSKLNFSLSHQENFRKEFDRALIDNKPELDLNLGTTALDFNYEVNKSVNSNFQFGTSAQRQANVWNGSRFFIPNYTSLTLGLYAIQKWTLNNFNLEAGLRYDYRNLNVFRNQNGETFQIARNFNNVSSSFAINYVPNNNFSWLNNFSLSWRPPNINELYVNGLHHGTANFEIGDPNLNSETGFKYNSQFNFQWNENTQVELGLYTNYIQNFINLVPVLPPTLTLRGAYPTFMFKQADALLSGGDLTFNTVLIPSLGYRLKASVLLPRNLEANTWLQQMPAPQIDQEFSWYFSPNKKSSYLSANFLWVGQQRFIPNDFIDYLAPPRQYF